MSAGRVAIAAVLASSVVSAAPAAEPPERPPNLVLVIGDDQSYRDFGFMGSQVARTPRLDRLAAEGTVFTLGYSTASLCKPALRTLLTGLLPIQFEAIARERGSRADPAQGEWDIERLETLPRILASRGYASFQAGKYRDGPYTTAGFTEGMNREPGAHEGDALARETMQPVFDFVDRSAQRPFFLWFAPKIPHLPHDPPQRFLDLYAEAGLPPGTADYYGSVSWFDWSVGALLDHLEARGLRENTLVVYVVDNGWQELPDAPFGERIDPNVFLLGGPKGKASFYDEGFRTPIVFAGPGVPAGRRIDSLVSIVHLFPTLLDYAGADAPRDRASISLRPALEGRRPPPGGPVIGHVRLVRSDRPDGTRVAESDMVPGGFFVRTEDWHYFWSEAGEHALFSLGVDPEENEDVVATHPDFARKHRARIRRWMRRLGIPFRFLEPGGPGPGESEGKGPGEPTPAMAPSARDA